MRDDRAAEIRIEISMDEQVLDLMSDGRRVRRFPISSGEKGMGFVEGSFRTPTGRFQVSEKIGDGEALGTRFVKRVPCGVWDSSQSCDEDLILTRIMRLDGLEAKNGNTMQRNIYIHGTNREDRIGEPSSHGCIRLRNEDMIELFEAIPPATEVIIHPLTRRAGKILFIDCDSTISSIEGIDELARLCDPATFHEVEKLTSSAMNGEVALDEVFKRRMEIIRPNRDMAELVGIKYMETIMPGIEELIIMAKVLGWLPVVLSGGFEPLIRPLAKRLGIKHVEAVPLFFDEYGEYAGYGEDYPTTRNHGKNEIIKEWKNAMLPERVVMIGDGVSDLETRCDVDVMIGYGGVVEREKVKKGADAWLDTYQDLDVITSILA
jgi:HAD superfamily phosphoserine phosphatase-like hydrolase